MKRKLLLAIATIALVAFVGFGVTHAKNTQHRLELKNIELTNTASQLKLEQLKATDLERKLNDSSTKTEQQIQDYQKQLNESKQREDDLNAKLQAKLNKKVAPSVANVITGTATASAASLSGNSAKDYIYGHESGNRTDAINSGSGACGLGQALPCSKLPCTLQDYACQDAWFTNYAVQRYGSWEAAAVFWQNNRWW